VMLLHEHLLRCCTNRRHALAYVVLVAAQSSKAVGPSRHESESVAIKYILRSASGSKFSDLVMTQHKHISCNTCK
jgi:hypothetical protein